uniref:Uncharacterized protein n=1 Tax=Varanus komodoensis TaxID=61221 RepID=A0A8D2KW49_VARKO
MATASAFTEVQQDTTCSICLDYLKVPVTVDCGHNFCHSCITGYCSSWEQMGEDPTCPNCRNSIWKENFRPNWQLANIVEKIKLLQQKQKNADLSANVTLNPHTAHPKLVLSEDRKIVRIEERPQKLPNNQERFDKQQFVLGQEGFAEGKHFWEVHVGSGGDWAVGVARKSMRRKGRVELCPEQGIWAVRYYAGAPLAWRPGRYLKGTCDGGQVAFYDADQGTLIHTFSGVSFSGETLLPFFYICKKVGRLSACPGQDCTPPKGRGS